MTRRGTGLLLVVLAALVVYLWMVEVRPRMRSAPASSAEPPPLLGVPASRVARLQIVEGDQQLLAVRHDGRWTDAGGRAWKGDAVADLLDALSTLRPVMVVDPDPQDPGDYGLGPDATRLVLAADGGQTLLDLQVGERNPAWTGVYARLGGHRDVVLVGAVLHWELEKLHEAAPEP